MKYVFAGLLGFALGVSAVAAVVYFNPATAENDKVPLNTRADEVFELFYGSMLADSIAYTNSGTKLLPRKPADIEDLWHASLAGSHAAVQTLTNADTEIAGIGVKMGAWSEATRVLSGKVLMNSVWYIYLPGTGSFFVEQQENYWPFIRSVAIPAFAGDGKRWAGRFQSDLTVGPGATLEGVVVGASGVLRGHRGEAREAIDAAGFSMKAQHTSNTSKIRHSLLIAVNGPEVAVTEQTD